MFYQIKWQGQAELNVHSVTRLAVWYHRDKRSRRGRAPANVSESPCRRLHIKVTQASPRLKGLTMKRVITSMNATKRGFRGGAQGQGQDAQKRAIWTCQRAIDHVYDGVCPASTIDTPGSEVISEAYGSSPPWWGQRVDRSQKLAANSQPLAGFGYYRYHTVKGASG